MTEDRRTMNNEHASFHPPTSSQLQLKMDTIDAGNNSTADEPSDTIPIGDLSRNLQYNNSSSYTGGGFEDYVPTTVQPGTPLFLGTLTFCLVLAALLPLFVAIGEKRARLRRARKLRKQQEQEGQRDRHVRQQEPNSSPPTTVEVPTVDDNNGNGTSTESYNPNNGVFTVPGVVPVGSAPPKTISVTTFGSTWGNLAFLDCTGGEFYGFNGDDDDLSFFDNIEKRFCDDELSLPSTTFGNNENQKMTGGESRRNTVLNKNIGTIHTPFRRIDSELSDANSSIASSATPEIYMKRNLPGSPVALSRQCDSPASNSSLRKGGRKQRSKRKKFKKAIKSITRTTPITVNKNITRTQDPQKIPKTTPLDGGFFGPRKHRRHLYFSESQMRMEERRDLLKQDAKKRKSLIGVSHQRKARRTSKPEDEMSDYQPPPLSSISFSAMKGINEDSEEQNLDGGFGGRHDDLYSTSIENFSIDFPTTFGEPTQIDECMMVDQEIRVSELCCGPRAIYQWSRIKGAMKSLGKVARFDNESRRLLSLMTPFTFTTVASKVFEGIDIVIISSQLGTDALAAYAVAGYFVGLTYEIIRGFTDALCTLSAHALGAENYHLAGQYIQLSQIMFVIAGIPSIFVWGLFTYNILIWLNMSENVAQMGQDWASVSVFACVANGFNESCFQFSSIVDSDVYSNVIAVFMSASQTASMAIILHYNEHATLVHVAFIRVGVVVIFIAINFAYCSWRGWVTLCWDGFVDSNAFRNHVAVKQILKTGIPLGAGALIRESEWGALLIFSSSMGAAEISTWTILRTFWDIFGASMEGICCAAEIRCAYHIGKGNKTMAKRSSYKSLLIGVCFGSFWTFVFYLFFEDEMPTWFTHDETLQRMLLDLVPLACLCNVIMSIGMPLWSLLGAQGRYRLASLITLLSGWLVTVPIGAFFVYGLNFDLQGLVAAVAVGYSISAICLSYLFIRSNWEKRITKVHKIICEAESVSSEIDRRSSADCSYDGKVVAHQEHRGFKTPSKFRGEDCDDVSVDLVEQLEVAIQEAKATREELI